MRKMNKIFASVLAMSMIMSLTACSSKTASSTTATTPASSAAASSESVAAASTASKSTADAGTEKVELTWWIFPNFVQDNGAQPGTYEQTVVDKYVAAHSNVSIKLETIDFQSGPDKITSAIQGGTAPDILFDAPGRIIDYGRAGKLASLDDMFTDDMVKDVGNDAIIDSCKGDGVAYMYPISTSPFYMAINKDMWEKAGAMQYVNLDGDRTWTYDNFLKGIKAVKDAGYTPGTLFCGKQGGDQGTRAFLCNLYGATIANAEKTEYTFGSTDAGLKALNDVNSWLKEGLIGNGTTYAGGDDIEQFVSGQFSYELCWGRSTYLNNADKLKSFNVNAISLPWPSQDGTPKMEYLVNGFCIFNNGNDAKVSAAKDFLKYICDDPAVGPDAVKHTGAFPVRQSFGDLYPDDTEMQLLSSWTKYYAPYYNTMKGFTQMRVEWYTMLQAITTGEKTPDKALQDYMTNSNAAMKQ